MKVTAKALIFVSIQHKIIEKCKMSEIKLHLYIFSNILIDNIVF